MDLKILEDSGLSQSEAKVYLALLELGSALAGQITQKAEINRTNVYDALERLIKKGLVTYVVTANRKVFEPIPPTRLLEILKEKQDQLTKSLPELNELFKTNKTKEEATLFKGKKGIKTVYELILKEKKPIFIYGAEGRFADIFPAYQKEWNRLRAELKIPVKIIWSERVRRKKIKEQLKFIHARFLPKTYEFPSLVMFSGDLVFNIIWTEMPFAFMIRSPEAAKSNKNFFELLWGIARK